MPRSEARLTADNPRALLLDFDGTLADTLTGLRTVYQDFLIRISADNRAPSFESADGANLSALIPALCRRFAPQEDPDQSLLTYWHEVEQAILSCDPAPGARKLMNWARGQGWKLGIATAGRTNLIETWLKQHDLAMFIDSIIGADICERAKPDPMPYWLLMDRLGVLPEASLAIEDSASGIASATAAGVEVILLGTGNLLAGDVHEVANLEVAFQYLVSRFNRVRAS